MAATFIKTIVSSIVNSAKDQSDPEKRTVTKIGVDSTDIRCELHVTTASDDGWAEEEHVLLTYDVNKYTPEYVSKLNDTAVNEKWSEKRVLDELVTTEFDEFLILLDRLFALPEWDQISQHNGMKFAHGLPESTYIKSLVEESESVACRLLITNTGGCNDLNIAKLMKAGYDVWPGDSDSYGWLTGCIESPAGCVLVYG